MAKKRILIVDDEKFFIEPVKRLLESLDYEVFEALDGISGLSKAREVKPDLIMLDLMLPGMAIKSAVC
jgi:CheY-like chemotaxis protein